MICKKCMVAAPDDSKICPHCDAHINRGSAALMAMELAVVISIIILCSLYFYFQPDLFDINSDFEGATLFEAPAPGDNETNQPDGAPAETPHPAPSSDLDKELSDVYEMLNDVYSAALRYYNETSALTTHISKNGFLYNIAAKEFVNIDDLINENMLDSKYRGENLFIMNIAPNSLKEYKELNSKEWNVSKATGGLAIFTAYETKDGIAILSGEHKGILYREHFNALVQKYDFKHGEIRRPSSAVSEYDSILNAILSYDLIMEQVYVRYMSVDDKYAVAVISTQSEPNKLSGYVLENLESGYSMIINNFEESENFIQDINNKLPDINLELLPAYNLFNENKNIRSSFTALTAKIAREKAAAQDNAASDGVSPSEGVEIDEDPLAFSSGNDKYAYLVFESRTIILGVKRDDSNDWDYSELTNWLEGEVRLREMESIDPPTYIIWQK